MLVQFDARPVGAAAEHIRMQAAACRALATAVLGVARVSDADVRLGLGDLVEVGADAFELVALDLELLATRMHAGTRLYDAVERAAAAAAVAGP